MRCAIFHLLFIYSLLNSAKNKLKLILNNCGDIEVVQLLSFAYIEKYFNHSIPVGTQRRNNVTGFFFGIELLSIHLRKKNIFS